MPRPQRAAKARLDALTWEHTEELLNGPHRESQFFDEAHRREVWDLRRDDLCALHTRTRRAGWRPWSYWQYDAPAELRDSDDYNPATLEDDHDELLDGRLRHLLSTHQLAEWEVNRLLEAGADSEDTLERLGANPGDAHGNKRFHQRIVRRADMVKAAINARAGGRNGRS